MQLEVITFADHIAAGNCKLYAMSSAQSQQASFQLAQIPLKRSYKSNPSSALVTLKSSGTLDSSSITCSLNDPNTAAIRDAHKKVAGLHPMAGGPEASFSGELCSGNMLLEALVGCTGVTLKAVATTLGIPVESGEVRAEGDLDFKGTLGVDQDAPVGFTEIRLVINLRLRNGEKVDNDMIEMLAKMTEKYCVVLQTIAKRPRLRLRVDGGSEADNGVERTATWAGQVEE